MRWIWTVVACGVAFAAAALLATTLQEDEYTAESTLLFRGRVLGEAIPGLPVSGPNAQTTPSPMAMEAFLSLPVIADRTGRSLPGDPSGEEISDRVELQTHPGSHLVTVRATDSSANAAAAIANAYSDQAVGLLRAVNRRIVARAIEAEEDPELDVGMRPGPQQQAERILRRLEGRLQALSALQVGTLEQVEPAASPPEPSSPDLGVDALLALLVGLCAGAVLATALQRNSLEPVAEA